MKTVERYVFGAFLASFFLAFLVLSFVLTIGLMVQIVGYMLQGLPVDLVCRFAVVAFPETMQWTIPMALLVSSILVFSRMSADNEVAAMRACGVNLLTVMRWPLLFALGCTLFGLFINNEIVPRGHEVRRNLLKRLSVGSGLDLFEPGVWIKDIPGVRIYFERREGQWLKDLIAIDYSQPGGRRMVDAKKALVEKDGRDIVLDLQGVTFDNEATPLPSLVGRWPYRFVDALKDDTYKRREKDFRFFEMLAAIRQASAEAKNPQLLLDRLEKERQQLGDKAKKPRRAKRGKAAEDSAGDDAAEKPEAAGKALKRKLKRHLSDVKTEFQKRWVFAFASICFVLVGVPLGIRSQRKESTIGMAIALVTALCYYLVVILMMNLSRSYSVHPEVLIWLPVALCVALAGYLIPKNL